MNAAADDFDVIRRRMAEIKTEEEAWFAKPPVEPFVHTGPDKLIGVAEKYDLLAEHWSDFYNGGGDRGDF